MILLNDKEINPQKLVKHKGEWLIEGADKFDKKVVFKLSELTFFNSELIDEIFIIRPLTTKIEANKNTNIALKIYVDSKERITDITIERRAEAINVPILKLDLSETINDAYLVKIKKRR